MNYALQDGEDSLRGLLSLLILDILVPKGMSKEIKTNMLGRALKQTVTPVSVKNTSR